MGHRIKKLNYQERAERLRVLTKDLVSRYWPLLAEIPIDEALFSALEWHANSYIGASLNAMFGNSYLYTVYTDRMLMDYPLNILTLANVTPNGMVMPKYENALAFNILHRAVADIFSEIEIHNEIEYIHLPATVRIIDGVLDAKKDARPYSSTKIHCDLWNGDPRDALPVFIPVLGDIASTTIEFFEPDEIVMNKYLGSLADYDEGSEIAESAQKYDCTLRPGYLYIADSFLLHRTVKRGGGLRLSIDFRIIPRKKVPSDGESGALESDRWKRNFVPLEQWYAVGKSTLLIPKETFQETIEKFSNQKSLSVVVPMDYADYFTRIEI